MSSYSNLTVKNKKKFNMSFYIHLFTFIDLKIKKSTKIEKLDISADLGYLVLRLGADQVDLALRLGIGYPVFAPW